MALLGELQCAAGRQQDPHRIRRGHDIAVLDRPAGCALMTDPQAVAWTPPEFAWAPPERLCSTLPQLLLPQVHPPAMPEAPHAGQVIGCLSHAQVLRASALTWQKDWYLFPEEAAAAITGQGIVKSTWAHQHRLHKQDGRLNKSDPRRGCFSHAQLLMASAHIDTRSLYNDP